MTHTWFNRGSLGGVRMVNQVRVAHFRGNFIMIVFVETNFGDLESGENE